MIKKELGKIKHKLLSIFDQEPAPNVDPTTNGEYRALQFLMARSEISQHDYLIDVGANIGDWTSKVIAISPQFAHYYCVEPIPQYANSLIGRFSGFSRVTVLQSLLSNISGNPTRIYSAGGGGRMYLPKAEQAKAQKLISGDAYSSGRKVVQAFDVESITGDDLFDSLAGRPYMIKVDCDGHDGLVLSGFYRVMERARPIVQFEYCDLWLRSNSRLADMSCLFQKLRYDLFRVFPDRLKRFRYMWLHETYQYQNIIAIPVERSMQWIEADGAITI